MPMMKEVFLKHACFISQEALLRKAGFYGCNSIIQSYDVIGNVIPASFAC